MARRDITGVVDFAYLETFAAGEDDVIDEVLALFREQSAIWGAMLAPDHEGWRDAVHTLKGASRGVGAFRLGEACEACEAAGPGGLSSVRDALDQALSDIAAYAHERALKSLEVAGTGRVTRVLLIRSSSLGDVIHCLPAVSDMARAVPDLTLDWVIEDSLLEIARLHPAVTRAIPVRLRYWRRHLLEADTWREFGAFRSRIAEATYDRVIDAQGLIRSAMLARLARGLHCGYDRHSVREPPASLFYDRQFPVAVTLHAVERTRRLVAQAMGYEVPPELDYGVRTQTARPDWLNGRPYLVALHATARPDKTWPEADWAELVRRAAGEGLAIVLPWGDEGERARSERIAAASPAAVTPPRLGLTQLAALLAGAAAVVGVDTGLTHLATAAGAPVVAIYAASWSEFNGAMGPGFVANLGGPGTPPDIEAVWDETLAAIKSGRRQGAWRPEVVEPPPELASRRRFRPSNSRAVVHRR